MGVASSLKGVLRVLWEQEPGTLNAAGPRVMVCIFRDFLVGGHIVAAQHRGTTTETLYPPPGVL